MMYKPHGNELTTKILMYKNTCLFKYYACRCLFKCTGALRSGMIMLAGLTTYSDQLEVLPVVHR